MNDDMEIVRLRRDAARLAMNRAEAMGAMAMIWDTVETLAPIGVMRPREELDQTFVAEALEIIRGIQAIADWRSSPH